jgi:DNA-binding HxlR family transcriptional regulator
MTAPISETRIDESACRSFQSTVELVGRRWTAAILLAGLRGARRFREYRGMVTGVSDRLLAQRLKELEDVGLIERTVIPSTPVQILYTLRPAARDLMAAMQPLVDWSVQRQTGQLPAGAGVELGAAERFKAAAPLPR